MKISLQQDNQVLRYQNIYLFTDLENENRKKQKIKNSFLKALKQIFQNYLIKLNHFQSISTQSKSKSRFLYKLNIIIFSISLVQSRTVLFLQIRNHENELIIKTMNKDSNSSAKDQKISVIGVDLGASFSKIAAIEKGTVDVITNQANLRQTPTIIGYGHKERLIGESGSVKLKSNFNNSIIAPQKNFDIMFRKNLNRNNKLELCPLKYENEEYYYKVNCQGQETKITPEQALAAYFTKIQQIIELNNINSKYLTVAMPSYFTHHQKQALIDSLQISKRSNKFQGGVQLVTQSAAVGFDYGYHKKTEFSEKEEQGKNVLFIDFGSSKLSLYVIKFTKNYQKIIYSKNLRNIGCKNLDELMLEFYSKYFESNNPNLDISISESKKATLKLLDNIEKQRKVLSSNSQFDFNIDCLLQQCDISYTMTRGEFQKIIFPVLEQIKYFLENVTNQLKQKGIVYSSVQLIGGGSRIPIFIKIIGQIFQIEPSRTLNSSECIARGATLLSAMNSGLFRMQPYYTIEQSPESIICNWKNISQQIYRQQNQLFVYQQSESLFSKKQIQIVYENASSSIQFMFLSSYSMMNICQFSIDIPPQSTEKSIKIKLIVQMNSNNMLSNITAYQVRQILVPLKISQLRFYQNLSQAKINEYEQIERRQKLKDIEISQYYQLKNQFQSFLYQSKEKISSSVSNSNYRQFINPQNYNLSLEKLSKLENQLDNITDFEQKKQQIKETLSKFFKKIEESKKSYLEVERQLNNLSLFISNVINGKIKKVRFYPKQEIQAVQKWIYEIQERQKSRSKYQQTVTSVKQINEKLEALKQSIDKLQQQMSRQQRQHYQQRQYNSDPFGFNPFRNTYHPHQYEPRKRNNRNNSFNGYNSGIFSGFSNFF